MFLIRQKKYPQKNFKFSKAIILFPSFLSSHFSDHHHFPSFSPPYPHFSTTTFSYVNIRKNICLWIWLGGDFILQEDNLHTVQTIWGQSRIYHSNKSDNPSTKKLHYLPSTLLCGEAELIDDSENQFQRHLAFHQPINDRHIPSQQRLILEPIPTNRPPWDPLVVRRQVTMHRSTISINRKVMTTQTNTIGAMFFSIIFLFFS